MADVDEEGVDDDHVGDADDDHAGDADDDDGNGPNGEGNGLEMGYCRGEDVVLLAKGAVVGLRGRLDEEGGSACDDGDDGN